MVTRSPVSFGVPFHGPHSSHFPARVKREIPARPGKEAREMPLPVARLKDVPAGGSNAPETMENGHQRRMDISRGRSPRVGACRSCSRASVLVAPLENGARMPDGEALEPPPRVPAVRSRLRLEDYFPLPHGWEL